jgi:hypothetical protein
MNVRLFSEGYLARATHDPFQRLHLQPIFGPRRLDLERMEDLPPADRHSQRDGQNAEAFFASFMDAMHGGGRFRFATSLLQPGTYYRGAKRLVSIPLSVILSTIFLLLSLDSMSQLSADSRECVLIVDAERSGALAGGPTALAEKI